MITPEQVDAWRVVPRVLVAGYGALVWRSADWFMSLPDPTTTQAAYISAVATMAAAFFGLYVKSGGRASE